MGSKYYFHLPSSAIRKGKKKRACILAGRRGRKTLKFRRGRFRFEIASIRRLKERGLFDRVKEEKNDFNVQAVITKEAKKGSFRHLRGDRVPSKCWNATNQGIGPINDQNPNVKKYSQLSKKRESNLKKGKIRRLLIGEERSREVSQILELKQFTKVVKLSFQRTGKNVRGEGD